MADSSEGLGLHRFAVATAVAALLLIGAGGLVTSTDSGLSVPDWPTTYGQNPFTFPISQWVGGIRFEHSHRLVASAVGLLTVVLAVWLARREPRRSVRVLGYLALAAVVAQGLLGGLTVLLLLPTAVSVAHACLAQAFFCLVTALAVVTSPRWRAGRGVAGGTAAKWAAVTPVAVFGQLLIGAVMRHSRAGLAIPDFPLAFGRLIPPMTSFAVAIHFAHRVGAVLVLALVLVVAVLCFRSGRPGLRGMAVASIVLVAVQIGLGAATVLSRREVLTTTSHVVVGALLLSTTLILALASRRLGAASSLVAARQALAAPGPAPAGVKVTA